MKRQLWVSATQENHQVSDSEDDFRGFVDSLQSVKGSLLEARREMAMNGTPEEMDKNVEAITAYHDLSDRIFLTAKNLKEVTLEDAMDVRDVLRVIRESQEICSLTIASAGKDLQHVEVVVKNAQLKLQDTTRSARAAVSRHLSSILSDQQQVSSVYTLVSGNSQGLLQEKLTEDQLKALAPIQKAGLPNVEQLEDAFNTLLEIVPLQHPRFESSFKNPSGRQPWNSSVKLDKQTASTGGSDACKPSLWVAPSMPKRSMDTVKLRNGVRHLVAGQAGMRFLDYLPQDKRTRGNAKQSVSAEEGSTCCNRKYNVLVEEASSREMQGSPETQELSSSSLSSLASLRDTGIRRLI